LFIAWVTLLSSMTLYYALSFVLILRIINHITGYHTLNALALIILYFGTILFPLSTIGFIENFGLIGFSGILYFMLVRTDRPHYLIVSGLFMLLSLQIYYQSILLIIPMTFYLIYDKRPYWLIWLGFSLLGVALILLFNWIVFDGPLDFPENHWIGWNDPNFRVTDLGKDNSLSRIFNPLFIMSLLFNPRYGLFIFMPIVAMFIPAVIRFHRTNKPVALLCELSLAAYFFFILYLGKMAVRGIGSNFGFRYIVPFMPFVIIILTGDLLKNRVRPWQIIVMVGSLIINTAGAFTDPHISPDIPNPLIDHTLTLIVSQGFETFISHFLRQCLGFNSLLVNYVQVIPLVLVIWILWRNELFQWWRSLKPSSSPKTTE
ncbi:MAG: hypothetical protein KBA26_14995, partial [Candidatus Delongbacteria bacterium]|nr:hypothetical protein [Candidatus Delongbacteria bacterium]